MGYEGIVPLNEELWDATVIQLNIARTTIELDLLTSMSHEDENSVFSKIDTADIWGMRIPIVGKRTLLRAKLRLV